MDRPGRGAKKEMSSGEGKMIQMRFDGPSTRRLRHNKQHLNSPKLDLVFTSRISLSISNIELLCTKRHSILIVDLICPATQLRKANWVSEWERNIIFNRSQNTIYNRFELHAATCESSLAGGLILSRLVELAHSMWALKETSVERKKSNIFTFAANERHPVGEAHTTWLLQAVKWSK